MVNSKQESSENTITFQVPPEFTAELYSRGQLAGLDKHQYAKQQMIFALTNAHSQEISWRLDRIEKNSKRRNAALQAAVETLLVHAGRMTSEQAKEWIDTSMPK